MGCLSLLQDLKELSDGGEDKKDVKEEFVQQVTARVEVFYSICSKETAFLDRLARLI